MMKLHIKQLSPVSCSPTASVYVPPLMTETRLHIRTKQQAKLWFCCILIVDSRQEDKGVRT
jgi:hypothetical protein